MKELQLKINSIDKAKNKFIEFLKKNNATNIEEFESEKEKGDGWNYYRSVDGFIGDNLYISYFMIWEGKVEIEISSYDFYIKIQSIKEFFELIKTL